MRGWIYRDIIFSILTIFGAGVTISRHYIFTADNTLWGGDYIVTLYFHSWQYLVRGWIYRDIIFSLLTIFGEGVIISWHYIFTLTIFSEGINILWHYIFTPDHIWCRGDYIETLYFHCWQYFVRGDYIVTWYSHPWQYLVRGWLYRDIIFSLLAIFGQVVIISRHYIFTPAGNIWWGGDYIATKFFTSEDIWWGDDYIVTLQYHFWHYLGIWHWRWLYLNIFTNQIWLCSDTRVLLFISIYSPHETCGVIVIIFKHDTLCAVET